MHLTRHAIFSFFFILLLVGVLGCRSTRRLSEGQYLLVENKIVTDSKPSVSESELQSVLKQKPNRKIFGFIPFHLFMYNLPNPQKMERKMEKKKQKKEAKDVKTREKIEKVDARLKAIKDEMDNTKDEDQMYKLEKEMDKLWSKRLSYEEELESSKRTIGEWLRYSVGEEPVIIDSFKVISSVNNLHYFLFKKGYFHNKVGYTVTYNEKKKKAEVNYQIELGNEYRIRNINSEISDKKLARQIKTGDAETLIKSGDIIDFDGLEKERVRITDHFQDRGYHFFSKEFIYFDVDTAIEGDFVDLTMGVQNITRTAPGKSDSIIELPHTRYLINEVIVFFDYDPVIANDPDRMDLYDTTVVGDHKFIHIGKIPFKTSVLMSCIYMSKGYYYRKKEVEATFKRLGGLGVFKSVNIQFVLNPDDPSQESLNSLIYLNASKKQNFSLESNGTNRGGNLGINGNMTYRNKNLFRGAELFSVSLSGGIEAQQLLANEDQSVIEGGLLSNIKPLQSFNTLEFGPEVRLSIPKFVTPFNLTQFSKNSKPHTIFTASLNYQERPDFQRTVQDLSLGYEWVAKGRNKDLESEPWSHYFSPVSISAVKINPDSSFIARLEALNDQLLLNSYRDHFILGNRYSLTYNNQKANIKKNVFYVKWGLEQAGNGLRQLYELSGLAKDSIGKVFGIQFAQFVKTDIDLRYTINFNRSSQLAYRIAGGLGLPMRNFDQSLPFEKSFFSGGANGLRGWKARTVGPGSYMNSNTTYDRIGDILLEGNMEYRFDLFGFLKGAMFVDAGNIWNLNNNPARPGSGISTEFYKEIAFDAGIGIRFDLEFFILRFDFATPIKDPGLFEGERWVFQPKTLSNQYFRDNGMPDYSSGITVNLGIGMPF